MSFGMYQASVPAFVTMLNSLHAILDKAERFAEERKIAPEVLLNWRLAPDMFPLTRQVQIASDMAKGAAARLAGRDVPKYADDETSFGELKARVAKTVKFIESVAPKDFDGSEDRDIAAHCRRAGDALQGRALSHAFRLAESLFPRHRGLRHPQALRARNRQARFPRRGLTGRGGVIRPCCWCSTIRA